MNRIWRSAAVVSLAAAATGCTSTGSAVQPSITSTNIAATTTLQFAVGTANFAGIGTGLNTVVTYRQPSGLSATLLNTPTITGPAGFAVAGAAVGAGTDAGTNRISASPQVDPGLPAAASTFGTSGGAFAYGFAPQNSAPGSGATFSLYTEPFYVTTATKRAFIGGPPAYPTTRDGTFPSGFNGYTQGFTSFANVTLATGTYNLSVLVPTSNVAPVTQTASATLSTLTTLGAIAAPTFAHAGVNGGTVSFTAPAGVVESMVYVVATSNSVPAGTVVSGPGAGSTYAGRNGTTTYYSALVKGTGALTATIGDNLGPHVFQAAAMPTFNPAITIAPSDGSAQTTVAADSLSVYVVGFDYPAFEAGPPGNLSPNPTIVGGAGQADLTVSPATPVTYS